MKVLIHGDTIPHSVDCSIAFYGFEELNSDIDLKSNWLAYDKEFFEQYECCVGGVDYSHIALNTLEVKFSKLSCYPSQLNNFLKRKISIITFKELVKNIPENKFFKPVKPKRFNSFISSKDRQENLIFLDFLTHLDEHEEIYVCDLVQFESEWRVYVDNNRTIKQICNYSGSPTIFPDISTIKEMINTWYGPCCYALDVGVVKNETILVEVNDFYSIGNYGLYPKDYAEMLLSRWKQLSGQKCFAM